MSKEKQIESTDWLTRGIPKEQLERKKREAIFSHDLEMCFSEFVSDGEVYVDYDATAEKMVAKGYRKQSDVIAEFAERLLKALNIEGIDENCEALISVADLQKALKIAQAKEKSNELEKIH